MPKKFHVLQAVFAFCTITAPTAMADGFQSDDVVKAVFNIESDGSISGETQSTYTGHSAQVVFEAGKKRSPAPTEAEMKEMFKKKGLEGSLSFKTDDAHNSAAHYEQTWVFAVKRFFPPVVRTPIKLPMDPFLAAPTLRIAGESMGLDDPSMNSDFKCSSGKMTEHVEYQFPRNAKILVVPNNVTAKNAFIEYSAEYNRDGNTIRTSRTFIDKSPAPICNPEVGRAYKEISGKIAADLKAQILFEFVGD